jgi:hypothetical protein
MLLKYQNFIKYLDCGSFLPIGDFAYDITALYISKQNCIRCKYTSTLQLSLGHFENHPCLLETIYVA